MTVSKVTFDVSVNMLWFLIIMTMLVMYFRYIAPLTSQEQSRIHKQFLQMFKVKAKQVVQSERVEEDPEEKRKRIYGEMADNQIEEIIRGMISVSSATFAHTLTMATDEFNTNSD